MNLAVFDLDHTLLPFDCEWVWINYVASHEGIDPKKAFAPLKLHAASLGCGGVQPIPTVVYQPVSSHPARLFAFGFCPRDRGACDFRSGARPCVLVH